MFIGHQFVASRHHVRQFLFGAGLCMVLGCGGGNDNRALVTGKVLLDGVPVKQGVITFIAENGPTAGAMISEGTYSTVVGNGPMVGKNRVRISSPQSTGKKIPVGSPAPEGTMVEETKEAIPTKYNTSTTLLVDVVPGRNQHDFDLKP